MLHRNMLWKTQDIPTSGGSCIIVQMKKFLLKENGKLLLSRPIVPPSPFAQEKKQKVITFMPKNDSNDFYSIPVPRSPIPFII